MAFDAGAIEATLTLDRTPFQKGLAQARAEAKAFTKDPIRARLEIDTRTAGAAMDRWWKAQQAKALGVAVNVDLSKADEAMRAWRAEQDRRPVTPKVTMPPGPMRQNITLLQQLDAQLTGLRRTVTGLVGPTVTAAGALSLLGNAAPVVGGLAAAVRDLAGGVLLLPGGISMLLATVAPLTVGLQGMGEAMQAALDAQQTAGKTAAEQAAANEKLAEALRNVSPAARELVRTVAGLKDEFRDLRLDVQQQLMAGLGGEVGRLAEQYLPVLDRGMGRVAGSLNYTARELVGFLREGRTVADISDLFDHAATVVHNAGEALRPFLRGLRDIGAVGAEYIADVSERLEGLAARFEAWAARARATGELREMYEEFGDTLAQIGRIALDVGGITAQVFRAMEATGGGFLNTLEGITSRTEAYLKTGAGWERLVGVFQTLRSTADALRPAVGAVLGAIGQALQIIAPVLPSVAGDVAEILQAAAPLLPILAQMAVTILPPIVSALSALSPILPAVAAGFLAVTAAVKGMRAVESVGQGLAALRTRLSDVQSGMGRTTGSAGLLSGAITAVAGSLGGGLLGAAIGAATLGLALLASRQQEAAEKARRHKEAVANLASALLASNGVIDQTVRRQAAMHVQGLQSYDTFRRLGFSLADLTDVALGNAGAYERLRAQLQRMVTDGTDVVSTGHGLAKVMSQQAKDAESLLGPLEELSRLFPDATQKANDLQAAMARGPVVMHPLQQAFQTLADKTASATDKANAYRDALDRLMGLNLTAQQTLLNFRGAIDGLTQSVGINGRTLDVNTAAGRANQQAILDAVRAAKDHALAVYEQTGSVDAAKKALYDNLTALRDHAGAVYGDKDAVDKLLGSVGGLPTTWSEAEKAARNWAKGTNEAISSVKDRDIKVTASGTFYQEWTDASGHHRVIVPMKADGGLITGPGGPRDDRVPALLSNGEYVINAASTRRYYPLIEAINQGRLDAGLQALPVARFASGGLVTPRVPRFASGGPVVRQDLADIEPIGPTYQRWDREVTAYMARMLREWLAAVTAPGIGSGVTRWSNVALQALSMLGQSASWLPTVLNRMHRESGGNPTVVNTWDINWQRGTPSVGLMQVIRPTFERWAGPFRNTGPFLYGVSTNPLANIYAGLNYAIHRYGSLGALNKPGGYDNGGPIPPGYTLVYNGTGRPENVRTAAQEDALLAELRALRRDLGERGSLVGQLTIQTTSGDAGRAVDEALFRLRHTSKGVYR